MGPDNKLYDLNIGDIAFDAMKSLLETASVLPSFDKESLDNYRSHMLDALIQMGIKETPSFTFESIDGVSVATLTLRDETRTFTRTVNGGWMVHDSAAEKPFVLAKTSLTSKNLERQYEAWLLTMTVT